MNRLKSKRQLATKLQAAIPEASNGTGTAAMFRKGILSSTLFFPNCCFSKRLTQIAKNQAADMCHLLLGALVGYRSKRVMVAS